MAIGVALVGGGIWAKEEHLPAVLASENFELKAIYSRSSKSAQDVAQASGKALALYAEDLEQKYEDLLGDNNIDAVIIALPIAQQASFVRKALSAGKHVLSEKPVAENVAEANDLIKWYYENIKPGKKATWSVAENIRYLNSFRLAREKIQQLGPVLGFRARVYGNIQQDGKFFSEVSPLLTESDSLHTNQYLDTEWRKVPTHQGGFLLDGGVHHAAALRLLLGPDTYVTHLAAFTTLLKSYLLPVDTLDSILKTNTGVQGTFQLSNGNPLVGHEFTIGCENGSVTVSDSQVTVRTLDGKEDIQMVKDERTGVPPEVRSWGEALAKGTQNPEQSPEQGLADLELVSLVTTISWITKLTINSLS
ncbi:hypothetical protein N7462_009566 [Penicillium macrosclerotiorum]|uniref:uncharacterized protein n=1 Tax=Penicillium macrosclerotiorum TaxID=303699 RepID=UPI0025469A7F|nr:uncharacterized protein N7462_009566 [Penicillium macrosclerotiorum]KAJ5674127.1 hypothetical protein N7462_009566 [Penicillium macrosclerotiorum]